MDAASYYTDLTAQYGRYAGDARGWHYGVWEPDVRSHRAALLRSNEILVRGLAIGAATKILDVGFGSGGFAVWAARRFGCEVTGITVAADHVPLAAGVAAAHGVADRCRFLVMDMDRLSFPAESFDVVINQDTLCHAADKGAYLQAVFGVLCPGGAWRAIDFSLQDEPLTAAQEASYREVCEGFHTPSLATEREVAGALQTAGFTAVLSRDLTPEVLAGAALILRLCRLPLLMMGLGLDWSFFSREPKSRRNRQGHVRAAYAYSRGLERGFFRHRFYAATRPAPDAAAA